MGTKNLQAEIKQLAKKLGWSYNTLARKLYTELHDYDNENEILKFQEKFKKQLQRPTTKPELLEKYLELIFQQRALEKIDYFYNKLTPNNSISEILCEGMKKISFDIDKKLLKQGSDS